MESSQVETAARVRIEDGGFWICADRGVEIAFERVLGCSTARRCRDCRQQRERTDAHEGKPTLRPRPVPA